VEFGKISDLSRVNWALPADDPLTVDFLTELSREPGSARFYIGTPAWGNKEWIGKIYPPKTKATEFLHHYSRNFNCIELNTTHYRIPSLVQTAKWRLEAAKGFQFCPKLFKEISHHEAGMLNRELLKEWFGFLGNLQDSRGPCFAQFPPHFDYSRKATLFHFLQQWPKEFELALEFRHSSWFENGHVLPALTKYLQGRNIGLVITDVAGRRDVLHTSVSADFTILRFIGNNLHPSDGPRAKEWARRLAVWTQQGLKRVYFMVHQPDDVLAPEMADTVIADLNAATGAKLAPLKWCETLLPLG
jgi:uncharacterized protein YecE (DUF72 family)